MKKTFVVLLAVLAAGGVGVIVMRDTINTALFSADSFADCLRTEMVAKYQSDGLMSGNDILAFKADEFLGPQIESLGHQIARGIDRDGLGAQLAEAKEKQSESTREWLEVYKATGKAPENETGHDIAEVTVQCMERQVRF
jgi:hypothetical protein